MELELGNLTGEIIQAGREVLGGQGPGVLESVYEEALALEMGELGLGVERQVAVPVWFKGRLVGRHRLDLLVEGLVVVELKAVTRLEDIHRATLLSYLRATHRRLGLLLNFRSTILKRERILNPYTHPEPAHWPDPRTPAPQAHQR